ncbi:hypothetical protein ILUMI_14229 [Ignelater luminosus]|uniref:Uncharacterized protein n=1 Tax=Ignelater luminosus TaxID=2038154 RepID=A0A8K0GA69_IGNLU|nr:hypothetical protein ILUMI_14229 [Ignelater luminosus]
MSTTNSSPTTTSTQNSDAMVTAYSGQLTLGIIANTIDVIEYFEKIEEREAYKFYKTDTELNSDLVTYDVSKNKFIHKFSLVKIPGEALLQLSKCFQHHDEPVSKLTTRLKILGSEILKEDLQHASDTEKSGLQRKCNDLVTNQFKIGLRKELMRNLGPLLMRTENLTIDQAEEFARQEELTK